ncbi:hypothetical protein J5893_04835 [bacterium]|nr:hypothetical protein [bacterium]
MTTGRAGPFLLGREGSLRKFAYNPSTGADGTKGANLHFTEVMYAGDVTPPGYTQIDSTTFSNEYYGNATETIRFADAAGNTGVVTINVTNIDMNPPVCGIRSPSEGNHFTGAATFTLTGNVDSQVDES